MESKAFLLQFPSIRNKALTTQGQPSPPSQKSKITSGCYGHESEFHTAPRVGERWQGAPFRKLSMMYCGTWKGTQLPYGRRQSAHGKAHTSICFANSSSKVSSTEKSTGMKSNLNRRLNLTRISDTTSMFELTDSVAQGTDVSASPKPSKAHFDSVAALLQSKASRGRQKTSNFQKAPKQESPKSVKRLLGPKTSPVQNTGRSCQNFPLGSFRSTHHSVLAARAKALASNVNSTSTSSLMAPSPSAMVAYDLGANRCHHRGTEGSWNKFANITEFQKTHHLRCWTTTIGTSFSTARVQP